MKMSILKIIYFRENKIKSSKDFNFEMSNGGKNEEEKESPLV